MTRVFSLCLLICIAQWIYPLDVYLNNKLYKSYPNLEKLCYSLPVKKELKQGIALDEILPLMIDAYHLKVKTGTQTYDFPDQELALELCRDFLVVQNNSFTLYREDRIVEDVQQLEIRGEPETAKELECWISWEGIDQLKAEIKRFAGLHNIDVKCVDVPQAESKLISVIRGGGTVPDVVLVQSDNIPALASARALQSVDYMLPAGLPEKGLEAFRLEQHTWAVPFYFDTQLVFYNTRLVTEKIAPGWNLDDLERTALALKAKGVVPLCWNGYSAYWLISFQLGFGKKGITEADGSIVIDDPATKQAFAYLLDLKKRGLLEPVEKDAMLSWFASGKTAMILSGSYSIPAFAELGIPFAIAPYPVHPVTGRPFAPLLDFKGWAITRKTRRPVLARRLIEYLTGAGAEARFTAALFKLPANADAWPYVKANNPYAEVLEQSYAAGAVIPPAPAYPVFKNTMWKLIRFIFAGKMTIDDTLAQGQAIMEGKLELIP